MPPHWIEHVFTRPLIDLSIPTDRAGKSLAPSSPIVAL